MLAKLATLHLDMVNRKDIVVSQIKYYILSHHLTPGDAIPGEQVLCAELGVSRSSVREALRRLEALDIVQIHQGKGTYVGDLSMSPLVEALVFRTQLDSQDDLQTLRKIVKVRRYLDLGVAEKICFELKDTSHPTLESLVEKMVTKAQAGQKFSSEDYAFHDGLLSLVNNEIIRELITAFWSIHTEVAPRIDPAARESLQQTAQAHGDMLRAAQAGDVAAYREAVMRHYAPIERILGE